MDVESYWFLIPGNLFAMMAWMTLQKGFESARWPTGLSSPIH